MDNQLNNLIEKIIEKKLKEMQPMTREPAEVVSVGGMKAVVRFLNGSEFELLNKSGEVLTAGDSVWVEYRTLPSAGYISMRNGETVGLYEPAIELAEENVVPKFRTHVKDVKRGAFSARVGSSFEFKVCDIENTSKGAVLHISLQSPNVTPTITEDDIDSFAVKWYGYTMYTQSAVWIGREAYVQLNAPWLGNDNTELYIVFKSSVSGVKRFNYDLFRINPTENSSSEPPSEYTHSIDPHSEGGGAISYSELVRYVCEEIATIKQRLDALGG